MCGAAHIVTFILICFQANHTNTFSTSRSHNSKAQSKQQQWEKGRKGKSGRAFAAAADLVFCYHHCCARTPRQTCSTRSNTGHLSSNNKQLIDLIKICLLKSRQLEILD